jgi:hypothetical protein
MILATVGRERRWHVAVGNGRYNIGVCRPWKQLWAREKDCNDNYGNGKVKLAEEYMGFFS